MDNLGFGRTQFGKVNCAFVPSQLNSSTSDAHEKSWEGEPLSRDVPAIRKLMYFPPLSSLDRSSDIKTSIDNTTFIYPLALLGFQHRFYYYYSIGNVYGVTLLPEIYVSKFNLSSLLN